MQMQSSEFEKVELQRLHEIAWDEWCGSFNGRRCLNVDTFLDHVKGQDVFLRYRLRAAFMAGAMSSESADGVCPRS